MPDGGFSGNPPPNPCATYHPKPLIWPAADDSYITYSFAAFDESGVIKATPTPSITDSSIGGAPNLLTGTTPLGSIDYATGHLLLTVCPEIPTLKYFNEAAEAYTNFQNTHLTFNGYLRAQYSTTASAPVVRDPLTIPLPPVIFTFGGNNAGTLVPGSLRFRWGTQEYRDVNGDGIIYRRAQPWASDAVGTVSGQINYNTRKVGLSDFVTAPIADVEVLSCLLQTGTWIHYEYQDRAPASNIQPGSFEISATAVDGRLLVGQSDVNGIVTGSPNEVGLYDEVRGTVDQPMGIIAVRWGKLVLESTLDAHDREQGWYNAANIDAELKIWKPTFILPNSIRINCVTISELPLSAEEIGIDPVRLPSTGRVQVFRPGNRVVVHNTQYITLASPVAGSVIDCGRTRLSRVYLMDASGRRVPDDRIYPGSYVLYSGLTPEQQSAYEFWQIQPNGTVWFPSSTNLDAGTVELASPLNLTGYSLPLKLYHVIEDSSLAQAVDLSGQITLNKPLTHNFDTESYISSQLFLGDVYARYTNLFSQVTWTSVWSDARIGNDTNGKYNDSLFPLVVTNRGCIRERWRIIFTSTTAFDLYGERVGKIASGTINDVLDPENPATDSPYFVMQPEGWGLGWIAGNIVRFNTMSIDPFWIARCVSQGDATGTADSVSIAIRGDSEPA